MNRVDFTKTGGILRTQDLHNFLQQSYTSLFAGLAALIGNNVIVAGVTDLGSTYSDGWVVINGELLPFVGGTKAAQIIVNETIAQSAYGDGSNKDAYYTRVAQCASTGGINVTSFFRMSNLNQLVTNSQLTTAINNLIASAPGALDTLKELADAIADDPNFASTMTAALAGKVAKAGDSMSGNLTVPSGTSSGHAVNKGQLDTKLDKGGDTMSGDLNMGSHKITNLANGVNADEGVNRGQLDNAITAEQTARANGDNARVPAFGTVVSSGINFNLLNAPLQTTIFYGSSFGPTNGWGANFDKYYSVTVTADSSGQYLGQVAVGLDTPHIYSRRSTNGGSSWSSWQTVI